MLKQAILFVRRSSPLGFEFQVLGLGFQVSGWENMKHETFNMKPASRHTLHASRVSSTQLAACLSILFLLGGCISTDLPPVGSASTFHIEDDEQRLWNRVTEEEQRLASSGQLYDDPELEAYVNQVARLLVPESVKPTALSFQVKILSNPLLNAFAYPNGVIYVHTGILAKMENEAQLATLLGHEMTHAIHRHAIKGQRSMKNTTAVVAGVQTLLAPLGPYGGGLIGLLGHVGTMAAITGYSRELEVDADTEGLARMVAAGYAPAESPKLFQFLKRDVAQHQLKEPFFFGTHPRLQDRIDSYAGLLAHRYEGQGGRLNTERFHSQVQRLWLDNASLDLALGRFGSALAGITRVLQRIPTHAKAHAALGELYRQRQGPGDNGRAEEAFKQALALDDALPGPHDALGLIYYKQGRIREAKHQWERYLALAPQAPDKAYVLQYLNDLKDR
jgi:predicted Zn-dependent protease